MSINYFLYARKSTDVEDKQVRSIDDQLAVLRTLAKDEDLTITQEFVERQSAKKPGRPVFNEMLALIKKGEAQGIICWKIDRLARNPVDGGQISWLLQQSIIQCIRTHDRNFLPADNVLMMSVEFGMANQFIRDLSVNTSRGLRHKAKLGHFPGTAPVGYLNDTRNKTIIVDRKKSKAVKAAFELYAQGNSRLEDIARFLFENGVRSLHNNPLHKDRARFILVNPFYYGHFRYGGEMYEGKHTPLIDKHLFDKVQIILARRGHPQATKKEPKAFCGLLKCDECGMGITAEKQKGHIYYRCTKKKGGCSQPYVREEALTINLSEILTRYVMPEDWTQELLKMTDEDEKKTSRATATSVFNLREQVNDFNRKLDRLTDLYIEQDIDREIYLAKRRGLMSEKKSVEEQIAKLEKGSGVWLEPMREWIKDASLLNKIAKIDDLPSKKSSLQKIFGSNLTLRNKKVKEIPSKQWATLCVARKNFSKKEGSFIVAPRVGFEPTTNRLTVDDSTIELPRNVSNDTFLKNIFN